MASQLTRRTMAPTKMLSCLAALLLAVQILLSVPSEAANSRALPGCPATCGDIDIPYPFGIGNNCSREGFEIDCNGSTPFLAGTGYRVMNVSLAPSQVRVALGIAWQCYDSNGAWNNYTYGYVAFNRLGVYRISDTHNQLFIIGCNSLGNIESGTPVSGTPYSYNYYTGCMSYCNDPAVVMDGRCAGVGCCKVDIPPDLTDNRVNLKGYNHTYFYNFSRCDYGFLVDKDSYTFRRADLNMSLNQMMPVWLDWAIRRRNDSSALTCEDAKKNMSTHACKSKNRDCFNAVNGPGYSCNCSQGYDGNAYLDGGCTNINECEHLEKYTCYGVCRDTEGSYDCTCPRGSHGNPRKEQCDPNFPRAAQLAIGIIFGVSCLIVLSVFLLMVHHKRKLREFFKKNGGPMLENVNNIKIFRKKELNKMTRSYSTVLGRGGFGEVYMGTMDNNQQVAVKRSITINEARKKEFANEINIQSQISHKNIVRLLGCCLEVDVPMLVYEFAPKGSLYDVLHGNKNDIKPCLLLGIRLDIAVDSAEALAYMHSSINQKILHGDVKSGNILLDDNFMPKVSDFGTSRLLSIEKDHTGLVIGDMNYIDPVYMKTGLLTEKSDVYSFGVVLLELITGKKPRYDENNSLVINFIKSYASENKAREIFDKEITSGEDIDCLQSVGCIAIACLREDVNDRPTMKQVAEYLQRVRREWKQSLGRHDQADEISIGSPPISLTMDSIRAETPSPLH